MVLLNVVIKEGAIVVAGEGEEFLIQRNVALAGSMIDDVRTAEKTYPSLFWILALTSSIVSDDLTSRVIIFPMRVLMKIYIPSHRWRTRWRVDSFWILSSVGGVLMLHCSEDDVLRKNARDNNHEGLASDSPRLKDSPFLSWILAFTLLMVSEDSTNLDSTLSVVVFPVRVFKGFADGHHVSGKWLSWTDPEPPL